tara:strand:- start:7239 stop:7859 length:621 start_codon:yes stop_codon:yes gene_type:complete
MEEPHIEQVRRANIARNNAKLLELGLLQPAHTEQAPVQKRRQKKKALTLPPREPPPPRACRPKSFDFDYSSDNRDDEDSFDEDSLSEKDSEPEARVVKHAKVYPMHRRASTQKKLQAQAIRNTPDWLAGRSQIEEWRACALSSVLHAEQLHAALHQRYTGRNPPAAPARGRAVLLVSFFDSLEERMQRDGWTEHTERRVAANHFFG